MNVNFDRVECMGWKDFARFTTGRITLHVDTLDTYEFYHLYAESLSGRHWDGLATKRETDASGHTFWVLTVWEARNHKTTALGRWGDLLGALRDLVAALHQLENGPHEFNLVVDWWPGPLPDTTVQ